MEAEVVVMCFEDGERNHKLRNAGGLLEAGKDKDMCPPQEPPEGMQHKKFLTICYFET